MVFCFVHFGEAPSVALPMVIYIVTREIGIELLIAAVPADAADPPMLGLVAVVVMRPGLTGLALG